MNATARGSIFVSQPTPAYKPATARPRQEPPAARCDLSSDAPLAHPQPLVIGRMTLAPRPAATPTASLDARLLAILDAPLAAGETFAAGYARKEAELGALLAPLAVADARSLHARLSTPRSGDELAAKFARLTTDRRGRLLAFLADVRRRQAIVAARR
jgi:hypothetical protein